MGELAEYIRAFVEKQVSETTAETVYRNPLVAFAPAGHPGFKELTERICPTQVLPGELLPGAETVVSFFVPFGSRVIEANEEDPHEVAREWAVAYLETNALIRLITDRLIASLAAEGVKAAAEPPTHNFDPTTLTSRWSHKSVAVVTGLGSFGLHQQVITDAGCAGRLGSLVMDAPVARSPLPQRERCLFFHDGSCIGCVMRCPVSAIDESGLRGKDRCWTRCQEVERAFAELGRCDVCGKCSLGECSMSSAVPW